MTVAALGAVASTAGAHTVLTGARSVPGVASAGPEVDNELRFYATFYIAYGLAALKVAPRADRDVNAVRALSATLFVAGLARTHGWRARGAPHPLQRALLAVELTLPPLAIAWQQRLVAARDEPD